MGIIDPKSENRKNLLVFISIMVIGIGIFTAYIIWGTLPLDKILDYEVVVYPQEDGSLEITYSYRWKVLNDSREGPLTWVSLGIPNSACRLMSYKGAIAGLHSGYYADGLIDFDLDRAYQKGEIAEFSFKIHQGRMLCRNKADASLPYFDFAPGWFEQIDVEHYRFLWKGSPYIRETNADRKEGNDYIWEGSLKKGERLWMKLYYEEAAFTDPELVDWTPAPGNTGGENSVDEALAAVILMLTGWIGYKASWGRGKHLYGRGRGYYGHGGTGGHGCACACAGCACACACAGGGRAGCSRKDFYHCEQQREEKKDDIRGSMSADKSGNEAGRVL